jgi:formylglycine-generating enzyme required for sulfatase activity
VWRPSKRAFVIGGALVVVGAIGIWLVTAPPNAVVTKPPAPVARAPPSVQPSPTDGVPLSPERERGLKPKDAFKECATCPEMVVVPAGSFTMGSPESEPGRSYDESPQHAVTLARQLAVGRFAVTFDEWDACVADGGCNGYKPSDQGWGRARRPVINVSWDDAKAYMAWLSKKIGKAYRLLSEAEREYVTRAGTTTPFWWGSSISTSQANYDGNYTYGGGAKGEYRAKTLPVDSFQPNPWGLYQVHGNVWEWVEDCWQDNYNGAPTDGSARTSGDCHFRVLRVGSWNNSPQSLRAANRIRLTSGNRSDLIGFRVGRTLTP